MDFLTTGKSGKGAVRVGGSGWIVITGEEESKSGWTRFGNSSGGAVVSTELKGRENSAEIEWMDFVSEGWDGNTLWEMEGELGAGLGNWCLKGKTASLKITSLERNIVLLDKSYNLYPLVPKGYPRNMHAFAPGSNLDLFLVKVEA